MPQPTSPPDVTGRSLHVDRKSQNSGIHGNGARLIAVNAEPASHTSASGLVRSNGRSAEVLAFEESVVGFFVDAADLLGVPKSVAAIYGICFASPEPLGFTEINERLDISSGSISQGLKLLRQIGALKVLSSPLEKRDRFEPDMELRKLATHFIEERLEKQLNAGKERLNAMKAAIPSGNGANGALKARIKALQTWQNQGRAVLPIIKSFLKLT